MRIEYEKFNKQKYEKSITDFIRKNWFSAIKNPNELYTYTGDKLPSIVLGNNKFKKIFTYIYYLCDTIVSFTGKELPVDIQKELFHFERQGKMCVHLSVLMYHLILYYKIVDERSMKYVQGYYWHLSANKDWITSMLGNEHAGSHAWITIGKTVVDISIRQEELFFKFDGLPMIMGEVPNGLLLKGIAEPKKTATKHAEEFAKFREISVQDWIESHIKEIEKRET